MGFQIFGRIHSSSTWHFLWYWCLNTELCQTRFQTVLANRSLSALSSTLFLAFQASIWIKTAAWGLRCKWISEVANVEPGESLEGTPCFAGFSFLRLFNRCKGKNQQLDRSLSCPPCWGSTRTKGCFGMGPRGRVMCCCTCCTLRVVDVRCGSLPQDAFLMLGESCWANRRVTSLFPWAECAMMNRHSCVQPVTIVTWQERSTEKAAGEWWTRVALFDAKDQKRSLSCRSILIYPHLCHVLIWISDTFGNSLANKTFMQHVFSTSLVGFWFDSRGVEPFLGDGQGPGFRHLCGVNRALGLYNPVLCIASELMLITYHKLPKARSDKPSRWCGVVLAWS